MRVAGDESYDHIKMARSRCVVDRITLQSIKQLQRRALNPAAPSDTRVLLHAPPTAL